MNPRLLLRLVFLVLAAWMAMISASQSSRAAGPWYVAPSGNDGNDCLTPATACEHIQAAINKSSSGDMVNITAGIYLENLEINDESLTLQGQGSATTIIDGNNQGRVLSLSDDNVATPMWVVVSGLRLQDGSSGLGGAIINETATVHLVIVDSEIANNATTGTGGGSGIFNMGFLNLVNVVIRDNSATGGYGGGIYNLGEADLNNATVTNNLAGLGGGGIRNSNLMTITNSTVGVNNRSTSGNGGGIYNVGTGSKMTLLNSTVNDNRAITNKGGGIYNEGILISNGTLISGNLAMEQGGGIYNATSGQAALADGSLRGNRSEAQAGGALFNAGVADLTSVLITNNQAGAGGGGISNVGNMAIDSNTITDNTAAGQPGGGISNQGYLTLIKSALAYNAAAVAPGGGVHNSGTARLVNVTLSNNTATSGGGIYSLSTLTLNNSTVSGNTVGGAGGGLSQGGGTVTLQNSLIGENAAGSAPNCSGTIGSAGYNLISNTSGCTFTPTTGDLTNVDPQLGLLQDNGGATLTHALLPGSPAMDAGNPAGCIDQLGNLLTIDQRGKPRLDRCDMGAYELQKIEVIKDATPDPVRAGEQLTYTIRVTNNYTDDLHATITDVLPSHITPSGILTWTPVISAPGGIWQYTFAVTSEVGYSGSLTNVVKVTTLEGPTAIYTKTSTAFAYQSAIEITQLASPDPVRSGEQLTYTLHVTNTGNITLTGTIVDILPAHVTPTGILTWPLNNLTPADVWTQTVIVTAEVGYSGLLTNVAWVTTLEGPTAIYTETSLAMLSLPPYSPSNPTPADGARDVPVDPVLTWQGGDPEGDPVTYTVAFGTSNPPPVVAQVVTATYDPGPLGAGITYYWIITATDGISTSTGPAWRFTTTRCFARLNDGLIYPTLQAAVDAGTQPTDVIKVAGYCAGVQERNGVMQTVYLSKTLSIRGGYTTTNGFADPPNPIANPTTLDALGQGRVFFISGNISPVLEGLRITGGDAQTQNGQGGGVYIITATATITNDQVFGNSAEDGGGLYLSSSASTLRANTIMSNTASGPDWASHGGGLYLQNSAAMLNGNIVSDNTTTYGGKGGGLYLESCAASLNDNTISDNTAGGGGGLYLRFSPATLNGNRVFSNTTSDTASFPADSGGGVYLEASNAMLSNNLIFSNTALDQGGGVYLMYSYGALLNNNLVFRNGSGDDGAGLYLNWSNAVLSGNQVISNTTGGYGEGAGVYLNNSAATLNNNIVSNNVATWGNGGGVFLSSSTATLNRNTVSNNTTIGMFWNGGGLYLSSSDAMLDGNVVRGNIAWDGGGIHLEGSDTVLVNNIIVGNQANNSGSGLYVNGSSSKLLHDTIAHNIGGDGSGVYVNAYWWGGDFYSSTVDMTNTLLVSQTLGAYVESGSIAKLEATLWGNGTDWGGPGTIITGTHNYWGDPAFVDPDAGDYHIRPSSAAVDHGVDAGIITDIDGDPRPLGAGYDIGADESYSPMLDVSKWADPDPVHSGEQLTYTIYITNTGNVVLNGTVTDTLPAHVMPTGVQTWPLNNLTPTAVWTKTVVVTVTLGYAGPLTNVVQVTTEEGATGIYTATAQAQVAPALTVTQQANSVTVHAGEPLTYTIRITNTGNITLTGIVTDTLPAKVMPTGLQTWTLTNLSPGNVWIQLLVVTVTQGYSGTLINRVQVTTQEGARGETQFTVHAISYQVYLPVVLK